MNCPQQCAPEVLAYARSMMRMAADAGRALGEWETPRSAEGHRLIARWYYWHAKECHPTSDALATAKRMYAVCRDMQARPDNYTKRPDEMTCWQWFQATPAVPSNAQVKGPFGPGGKSDE